jgi:hypothetical protein
VVAVFGAGPALLIGTGCFLLVAGAIDRRADPGSSGRGETQPLLRGIAEGFDYLRRTEALLAMILMGILFNFCLEGPIAVGLPYLASARFLSPTAFAVSAERAGMTILILHRVTDRAQGPGRRCGLFHSDLDLSP